VRHGQLGSPAARGPFASRGAVAQTPADVAHRPLDPSNRGSSPLAAILGTPKRRAPGGTSQQLQHGDHDPECDESSREGQRAVQARRYVSQLRRCDDPFCCDRDAQRQGYASSGTNPRQKIGGNNDACQRCRD
jgi:hypothetical protein